MRAGFLGVALLVAFQGAVGQFQTDTTKIKPKAQWGIEVSSIADAVNILSTYRRNFAFDPNIMAGVHLHTTTAFSGQLTFEYHGYRKNADDHNNSMTLLMGGVNVILFKTLLVGSGIYHFKSNETIQPPPDPIVRGFYDGGSRTGAYFLTGLRVAIEINEEFYVPIGYNVVFGSAKGGDGSWWYNGLRVGIGKKI